MASLARALVILVVACGGGSPGDDPSRDTSTVAAEAGKVRELGGRVTATRGSTTRMLAVGNAVSSDDVIDTGSDGSLVIELRHNNALWSLESGIKARVDQSVAWGLPKQQVAKAVDHATSAAGRHADRQAADTQVTAVEMPSAPAPETAPSTEPSPAPTKDVRPPTIAPPPPPPRPKKTASQPAPRDPAAAKPQSNPGGGGGCDEVSCLIEPGRACCASFRKSGRGRPAEADAEGLPNAPARQDIVNGMTKIKQRILACGKTATAKGTIKIVFKVGSDGNVTSAEVKQSPDPAIDPCVIGVAKTLKLPRSQLGVTFSYPIVIN